MSIGKSLTLNPAAKCRLLVNSDSGTASGVTARSVTINGAQVALSDSGTAIGGTFSNLADGSQIVVGNNTFQANYEGGDGNDLTLTVVSL